MKLIKTKVKKIETWNENDVCWQDALTSEQSSDEEFITNLILNHGEEVISFVLHVSDCSVLQVGETITTFIERSPTQPCKGGQLPQESVSHSQVGHFRHIFLHCSHPYIFLFITYIDLVDTHERIAKICVWKSQILEVFTGVWKWSKLDPVCLSFFFFLLTFQFPDF